MDIFSTFFIYLIIGSVFGTVIGFVLKFLFWRSIFRSIQVNNTQVDTALWQLAMQLQAEHYNQAREIEEATRRRILELPRRERAVYQNRLTEVVSGKKVLNPATGEWEIKR